jgi:hypothetical protein
VEGEGEEKEEDEGDNGNSSSSSVAVAKQGGKANIKTRAAELATLASDAVKIQAKIEAAPKLNAAKVKL